MTAAGSRTPIIEVSSLSVDYGAGPVIDRLSLAVAPGEVVGLVGESGCGKTTLGWSILGVLPRQARDSGVIRFRGEDLAGLPPRSRRRLLGSDIAFVPQSAMASLDPMYSVQRQLREIFSAHREARSADRDACIRDGLRQVGLSGEDAQLRAYPHQLSGGMKQRVTIAAAMLLSPALIIADEPTSSLDVTSQAQVLATFRGLIEKHGSAVIFITHDLGVVAQFCERVAVMYAGQIVEDGRVLDVFDSPKHPYTKMLLDAHPGSEAAGGRLATIPGSVPEAGQRPTGCPFRNRCPVAIDVCRNEPPWVALEDGRRVRCVHYSR
jgi:oligopeptide/dipeptide ABC transporter ATP-binding protein